MTVAELLRQLERCDPEALVLIPRDSGLGGDVEVAADIAPLVAGRASGDGGAQSPAVRLMGLASMTMVILSGRLDAEL
jgi:hypothetical protein